MQVKLKRKNKAVHFEAIGASGIPVNIDGAPKIGGEGKGLRPKELLLISIGGCSSIDIVMILNKQRQTLVDYDVTITGTLDDEGEKAFNAINFHFDLWGDLDTTKVEKAIDLSLFKYCSVLLSLDKTITIDYTYKIHPQP